MSAPTGGAGERRWEIHLSADAEVVVRDATRSGAATLAAALDDLARRGMHAVTVDRPGAEWSGHVTAGDHVITAAGRDSDVRIVVVRIEQVERHAAHAAVDVLPLRLGTRRALGSVLQGLDLDLRYTLRSLRRTPLFAAVVVATLGLAFGGATALLDVVHTVHAGALPFGDGDRLLRIRNANVSTAGETRRYNLTAADFEIMRAENRSFTEVVAMGARSLSLVSEGDAYAERVGAAGVSPNWTRTMQLTPAIGRTFTPDEERAGSDAGVALISHAIWQRRFGADSAVLGRVLSFDGGAVTIVGVMPPAINYPYDVDVWTPWTFNPAHPISSLNVVGRLRAGASLEGARDDAVRVHALRAEAGFQRSANGFDVATVRTDFIRDDARTIQALSAAVLFLLVLACVNVANLLVARFTTRRAELGLRAALGGRRDQQMRQMLLESALLFAAGGTAGMLLATWLRGLLSVTVPENLRSELGVGTTGMSGGVIALTLAVGLACGLLVGLVAAWRAIKTDPMTLLRQGGGGRGSVGRGGSGFVMWARTTLPSARFDGGPAATPGGYSIAAGVTRRVVRFEIAQA
ncbi:MAG: ABC transporter permease, partial [Gemmatimonadaceae bacterium]